MKKLNSTVARILALEAKEKIKTIADKQIKTSAKEAESSAEFLELKKLSDERSKLNIKYDTLQRKLIAKYPNISIRGGYGSAIHLHATNQAAHVDVSTIKDKILLANHITNVPPDKCVAFVVRQYEAIRER